ncbi:MAG: MaoC family dehydratase N-terminal domain-containing protein [Dehalococcoidia bacterium]|nr:MAG: MaoC family dehydratase N-terminal domain-containing protein [Dehalococcoidia bacterium]
MSSESAITEEMRRHIGTRLFPDFPPEEVTMWGIRRFMEATTDDNPLWHDDDYARKTGWGGIIAPPAFLEAFNPSNHAFRRFSDMSHMSLPFQPPFPRIFSAFNEYQFFYPLRPGDMITSICKLGDIYERDGKSGKMVFIRIDNEHRNQRDELVGITSEAMVSLEGSSSKSSSTGEPQPVEKLESQPVSKKQVYYDEVEVGTQLAPIVKEFTLFTILKWGAAVNDYGPHHFDYKFATEFLSLPNVIAHGPHNTAHLAQLVTNWIGGEGILTKHYAEMRGNVFPGDTLTFEGKVASKYVHDGEGVVECETWAANQNGRRVMLGKSTVRLPQGK